MKTFTEYLQEVHMKAYPMLLDDDLPDHFDDWLSDLSIDEWIDHGNGFAITILKETKKILLK